MARDLPKWMHLSHGAYYLVREGKWHLLSRDKHDALVEYARLTTTVLFGEFGELITRALADMKKDIADGTYKNYVNGSKRVLEAFREFNPEQIKPIHIAAFLDDNKDKPGWANLLRTFLNNTFTRAVRWGIVETNPVRDIKPFPMTARDRYITEAEYSAIREHAGPTLAALMDIAYITGQRMGDVRHMKYSDITADGIFVKQRKTKAKVLISLSPDLESAIKSARALHQSVKGLTLFHRKDGAPIPYSTLHAQWLAACKKAGVEDAHFHDIRAAAATDSNKAGLDSKTLLGHTTERSHNRYLRSRETKVATPNKARKFRQ